MTIKELNIECPGCQAVNKIDYGENICCNQCKKTFAGYTYAKLKKPLISTTGAILMGALVGFKADDLLEKNRYPVQEEFSLVNACLNSSIKRLTPNEYSKKQEICICAIKNTLNEVDYSEKKDDEELFMSKYIKNMEICAGQ